MKYLLLIIVPLIYGCTTPSADVRVQQDVRYQVDLRRIPAKEEIYRLTYSSALTGKGGNLVGNIKAHGISVTAQPGQGTSTNIFPGYNEPGEIILLLKVDVNDELSVTAEYTITQTLSYRDKVIATGKQSLSRITPIENIRTER